ncbi:hypothetical protein HW423_09160 [Aerococcaceae bacterium INB8]|uniref:Uncharacterized protein n=1 Tax=Ruoffia halotolerans TaxID=2748684 RepID=A0A839A7T4_9LACT|nr:hypothetical protein [Ruoffia halotolerans]MBA5729951.1 hypothetical protein [Ruoffia halotolerans]
MKKSLKTLVVSLLSANLIVGSMATIVQAEEDGDQTVVSDPASEQDPGNNPGNNPGSGEGNGDGSSSIPIESTPEESVPEESVPEESTPEESTPDETSESNDESEGSDESSDESEESDESTDEGTVTQPTYPVGPPSSYVPPRTVPRTPVSTSDESETSIATQFGINSNVENLESLLAASLEDPNFALAWEDYQSLINDFELNDITSETATMGSTFDEILTNFEGNVVPEQTTTEVGQNVLVFNYSEETEEGTVPAQIILIGDEAGNLIGSALLQASTTQTTNEAVSAESIQGLVDQENAGLYAQDLFVTALYQLSSNDVTYTTIATPSATEGAYEFITLDNEYVLSHTTGEAEETSLLNQLQDSVATYIEGIENQSEEVTEEPSEEATETGDEETTDEAETEETAEDEPVNQFVKRFAPANYEELTLLDGETIISGYEELSGMVDGVTLTVTPEELSELLGEPSKEQVAGNSTYYDYYSVEDERIVLLTLQVDSSSNVVTTMKYDIRTPRLDEEFAINIEELFALAETELSIENLRNSLDDANIVEHIFAGGHQIRHVWTSYTDPEMRNVEAYEDTETGNVELFYYDQD